SSRWYDITNLDTTPILNQSGTVFDGASSNPLSYWIPTIAASGQGHAALGFSVAGNNARPDAATTGRLAGDPLSTTQGAPVKYTPASANYNPGDGNPHRWGDYSYTMVDPNDDMTLWTIQEFVNATNSYAVKVAKLLAPPPATLDCSVPAQIGGNSTGDVT